MHNSAGPDERTEKFVQLLHSVLFFNIFSREELTDIVRQERLIKWKKFDTGQRIFQEGVYDQHFFIVIQGTVDIRKRQEDGRELSVGTIYKGEVFGETVVCDPGNPRRASAYAQDTLIVCEIDGTLIDTVPEHLKVKFMKKFLDLIVGRLDHQVPKDCYYQTLIEYAQENDLVDAGEFFPYTRDTAASDRNLLTQYIKYGDFLIAKKIEPAQGLALLQGLINEANQELDKRLRST